MDQPCGAYSAILSSSANAIQHLNYRTVYVELFFHLLKYIRFSNKASSSRPSRLQRNSATIKVNLTSIDAKIPIKKEILHGIMHTWRFLLVVFLQLWFRRMCITHDIPAGFVWGPYLRMKIYSGAVVINCYYFCTPHHFFVV